MNYLFISDSDPIQKSKIDADDRIAVDAGELSIFRVFNGKFEHLSVEADESDSEDGNDDNPTFSESNDSWAAV